MAIAINPEVSIPITNGTSDALLGAFAAALQPYEVEHPLAQVDLYRLAGLVLDPGADHRSRLRR